MFLGIQNGKKKFYTDKALDLVLYNLDEIVETQEKYVLDGDEYVLKNEQWEQKQAQAEAERVAMLSLTRGDVFRALYQAKQVTRAQLRQMIENNELISTAQKELALIDFDEALNFYRGNTLIDTIGLALGLTSAQLDEFFEDGNYEHLLV